MQLRETSPCVGLERWDHLTWQKKTPKVCHGQSHNSKLEYGDSSHRVWLVNLGSSVFWSFLQPTEEIMPCPLSPGKGEGGQPGPGAPGKGRAGGEESPLWQEGVSLEALAPQSVGFVLTHCSSLSELTMFRRRVNMILNLCLCVRPRQCVFCVLLLKNSSCDTATQLGLGLSCVLPTPTGTRWQIFLKV